MPFGFFSSWIFTWKHSEYIQLLVSKLTLCDPTDCSPPGFSVLGILQARTSEWVAMPSSWGSSNSGNKPVSPALAGRFLYHGISREAPKYIHVSVKWMGSKQEFADHMKLASLVELLPRYEAGICCSLLLEVGIRKPFFSLLLIDITQRKCVGNKYTQARSWTNQLTKLRDLGQPWQKNEGQTWNLY